MIVTDLFDDRGHPPSHSGVSNGQESRGLSEGFELNELVVSTDDESLNFWKVFDP